MCDGFMWEVKRRRAQGRLAMSQVQGRGTGEGSWNKWSHIRP